MNDSDVGRSFGFIKIILLSIFLGIIASFAALIFKEIISFIQNLIFVQDVNFTLELDEHIPILPLSVLIVFTPAVFGMFVVWITSKYAPEAKGHGVPEVMNAIHTRGGKISASIVLVKSIASSITIGSGGSAGREGPIVQICSAIGSSIGAIAKLNTRQRVIFVASCAAAGIAATFNTPIGAVMFAVELLLLEVTSLSLLAVSIAVSTSIFVSQFLIGATPAINIEAIRSSLLYISDVYEITLYIPFGFLLGILGVIFINLLYKIEDLFLEWFNNKYIRHIVGMLLVGLMLYFCYEVYGEYYIGGVGYATIVDLLSKPSFSILFLLSMVVFKLTATCLTLGTGGSGGIFSPSLFMGASFGALFATIISTVTPIQLPVIDFVIAGMAGMVSATTGAMLTSVIMAFEMTRNYDAILPILITAGISYRVRHLLCPENIYTLKLVRRGINLRSPLSLGTKDLK